MRGGRRNPLATSRRTRVQTAGSTRAKSISRDSAMALTSIASGRVPSHPPRSLSIWGSIAPFVGQPLDKVNFRGLRQPIAAGRHFLFYQSAAGEITKQLCSNAASSVMISRKSWASNPCTI